MTKIPTIIKNFDGGIANDIRDPRKDKCRMVTNFDISSSSRMTPYRDSEDGDSDGAAFKPQNYIIAPDFAGTYKLWALGVKSGTSSPEVRYMALTDFDGNTWTEPTNNSGTGTANFNFFVYYKQTGLFYGLRTGYIWTFEDADPTPSWGDSAQAITFTTAAQGLVHSKDDILYLPYDNKIASKNGAGAWNLTALTLPSYYKITSICEKGGYLAIACQHLSTVGNSRVFLWNMDSDTWDEEYDWGDGDLKILEEISGYLVGISLSSPSSTPTSGFTRFNTRIHFRYLSGNKALIYDTLIGGTGASTKLPIAKQKINNRIYFMLKIDIDGETREGVWSFGRSLIEPSFTIAHERTPNNSTVLTDSVLYHFINIGDYMFIAYESSSTHAISKTNDAESYTATSSYEKLFNTVDSQTTKKLLGVAVTFADLPTNAQVVLKYKIDENIPSSTWVTVFTHAVAGSIRHTAVNDLPQYKEIVLRLESQKGAEITGLKFLEETIDDDLLKI